MQIGRFIRSVESCGDERRVAVERREKRVYETVHRRKGLEAAAQLAGELLAFEEKCRDVVMIQVSHSSELAPAGHLFYNAKEENMHDQNLRDYLERKTRGGV